MRAIKQFQVRGIPGEVSRIAIGDRIIDYWAPNTPTDSVLIAHDGQALMQIMNLSNCMQIR